MLRQYLQVIDNLIVCIIVWFSEILTEEDSVIDSKKEALNYYTFYKVLSQENYDLGKSVKDFVQEFTETNKDYEESAKIIPHQVKLKKLLEIDNI